MPEDLASESGRSDLKPPRHKPTVAELGIDIESLDLQRSGAQDGSFEVAFVKDRPGQEILVLLRVAGDQAGRVLVYDRFEWECFIEGVKNGEFDDGTELPAEPVPASEPDPAQGQGQESTPGP